MGAGATTEALVIRQPEEMSIPLRRGEIFRLHCLSPEHSDRRRANRRRT